LASTHLLLLFLLEPEDLLALLLEFLKGSFTLLGRERLSLGHRDVLGEVIELVICSHISSD
jgi:hypothetical protein